MNIKKKTAIFLLYLTTGLFAPEESKASALDIVKKPYVIIQHIINGSSKKINLHNAVVNGNIKTVKKLLYSDDNKTTLNPTMLLRLASKNGQFEVANYLIEEGADINAKNIFDETPLHLAIKSGEEKLVSLLINQENIKLYPVNNIGETPLTIAQKLKNLNIIKLFLKKLSNDKEPQLEEILTFINNTLP